MSYDPVLIAYGVNKSRDGSRLNGIDPQAWLADVLGRIAGHPAKRLDELLPWNWVNARAEAVLEAA